MVRDINTASEFDEVLANNTYVVADFYATWCPPCKQIAPFYESLNQQHAIDGYLQFIKLDVEKVREISARYSISAMPTFMFFKESKQVAVNANPLLQGANPPALKAAAEKLGGLAKKRAEGLTNGAGAKTG